MIRLIERISDRGIRHTIHYRPQANVEIPDSDLEFRKPVAKKF